jgi:fumarate reductase subunit D
MKARRSREPSIWALFSAGGMLAALVMPALVALLWLAWPMGWLDVVSYADFVALARHPLGRLSVFGLVSLSLFHWAHRFRYTLYDGLQLYHLNQLIAILTYGIAAGLSAAAAYVVATL